MRKTIQVLLLTMIFGVFLQIEAHANQTITVQINHQKTLRKSKLTIKFASLVEDSRCPTDVQCIQAGNAKITIKVGKGRGAAKTFEINTGAQPQTIEYAGCTIELTDLNPKPATNIRIDRNGYKATFTIGKSSK